MVCKECGAYNAEHLTHCRVCAAKLRDGDAAEETMEQQAPARPVRNFAQAPQWPARAYSGAPEPQQSGDAPAPAASPEARPAQEAAPASPAGSRPVPAQAAEPAPAAKPAPAAAAEPVSAARPAPRTGASAAAAAAASRMFCTSCGKPLAVPDATFCAYCGARLGAAAQPAAAAGPRPAPMAAADSAAAEERPAKRVPPQKQEIAPVEDDEELEEVEEDDFSDLYDEDDEDYDDDYYDDEFDEDDGEDKPRRKGKGGTVLFIILVVVLLALIAFFGMYIVKKNYGGSVSNLFASLTGKAPEDTTPEDPAGSGGNIVSNNVTADNMSATIVEDVIDGTEVFNITVNVPTGSTIRVIPMSGSLQQDSHLLEEGNTAYIAVPRSIFLPDEYCDSASVTVTPQIEITLPDGTKKMLDVPSVTMTVPQVSLTLTEPAGETVEAGASGSAITVSGTVSDHTVEVEINGVPVDVHEGGVFSYDYTPNNVEGETIEVVAKKKNNMTARKTITVTPHVVKDLPLTISSGATVLRAADGKVTVEGTAVAGATVTAICENTDIVCGAVTVTDTGAFTCSIQVPKEGCYEINLAATAEGYNDAAVSCIVERAPTTKSSTYRDKALNLNKNYQKVVDGKATETTVAFTGKVKEIVQSDGMVIFTLEDSSGNLVYVCNRSDKNKIENDDLNKSKRVAGFNAGLYPETSNPYIWGWFIWNV